MIDNNQLFVFDSTYTMIKIIARSETLNSIICVNIKKYSQSQVLKNKLGN